MTKILLNTLGSLAVVVMSGCTGYGQPAGGSQAGGAQGNVVPAPAPAPVPAPAPAVMCNAQPAQSAVGKNSTASVMESARAKSGAQMARILRPGQMVTKEFDAQRINLEVDGNGRIVAVRCG